MADNPWNFDVPTQMRQFAEQSVEQAKKAMDGFLTAAQKTARRRKLRQHRPVRRQGRAHKVMGFAEQNVANSFEFAQKLLRAKDVQEVMALQQEFLKPRCRRCRPGEGSRNGRREGRHGRRQAENLS